MSSRLRPSGPVSGTCVNVWVPKSSSDNGDSGLLDFDCARKHMGTRRKQRGNWPVISTVPTLVEGFCR